MSADWALTDAIRDRLFKRLGLALGPCDDFVALANLMHPQSDDFVAELVNGDEEETRLTGSPAIAITACEIGVDTDKDGFVYAELDDEVPGAGQATINCYNDQARLTLVATGFANNNATVTLAPEAGYTLAGTIPIAAIGGDHDFAFKVTPPAYQQAQKLFNGDEEDDAQVEQAYKVAFDRARAAALQAAAALSVAAAFLVRTTFRRRLTSRSSETVLIDPGIRRRSTGLVEEEPLGLLEDIRLAMSANGTGSGVMKAGGPTQGNSNAAATGTNITFSTVTLGKRGVVGVISLVCVKGLDTTDPEFDVFYDPTDTRRKPGDGTASIKLAERLRVGKSWTHPDVGIEALLLDYSVSITNSSGSSLSTTAGDWIRPTGLQSSLSDGGKLYTHYDLAATKLEFYKTSSGRDARTSSDLVTYATIAATATVFTTQDTGNGLVLVGKTGGALADGAKGTVDYRPPVATQPSSRATVTITETVRGSTWLRAFRDGFIGGQPATPTQTAGGWEPHVAAAPNIDDGWIRSRSLSQHKRVHHRRA